MFGSFFIFKGFDKKLNYREPRYSSNAYVGGDAYNYIINSNYFTGYNVLGMGCYVITALCLTGTAIIKSIEDNQEQSRKFYQFIYQHPMFSRGNKQETASKQKVTDKFSANEWGQFPNITFDNVDQDHQAETSKTDNSESFQSSMNYNSSANNNQNRYYSYPQKPNEQWPRPYSQNSVWNSPISNTYNGQNSGTMPALTNQNDNNSRPQDFNKNM